MKRSATKLWIALADRLNEAFAAPFEPWDPAGSIPVSAHSHCLSILGSSDEAMRILSRGAPVTLPDTDKGSEDGTETGAHWLCLPIPLSARHRILAIGRIRDLSPEASVRVARLFLQAHQSNCRAFELDEQMNAALSQISCDFEQQTFLRYLVQQIEICEIHRPIEDVIRAILPRLQRVISAGSIHFVPHDAVTTGEGEWLGVGTAPADRQCCRDLIARYEEQLRRGPVIRNRGFSTVEDELPPTAVNLLVVDVNKDGQSLGWLIAFNRQAGFVAENEIDSGFGTIEAGLVQVTAFVIATHARNLALFQETEALTVGVVRALVSSIEARDSYTRGHSERVAILARRLAECMNLPVEECEQIYVAGLLHDVGKIGIADEVLRKPGRLTPEEFDEIKRHPEIGYSILEELKRMAYLLPGVLHHHERLDGAGYPDGLIENEIPRQARILAVADSWDAMTSARPYRQALSAERASQILREGRGTQWDPAIIDCFLDHLDEMIELCRSHDARPLVPRLRPGRSPLSDPDQKDSTSESVLAHS